MKLQIKQRRARIEILPMIDVIFFLLIFFMVYGTLAKTESAVPVELPKTIHVGDEAQPTLIVAIREDASVWIGESQVSIDELKERTRLELMENPNTTVVLHPERSVMYDVLIGVMDALAEAGVINPMLGVERKPSVEE